MTDAAITEPSAGNTQAERTALSDQRMFEVAIELVNERGTAKNLGDFETAVEAAVGQLVRSAACPV